MECLLYKFIVFNAHKVKVLQLCFITTKHAKVDIYSFRKMIYREIQSAKVHIGRAIQNGKRLARTTFH